MWVDLGAVFFSELNLIEAEAEVEPEAGMAGQADPGVFFQENLALYPYSPTSTSTSTSVHLLHLHHPLLSHLSVIEAEADEVDAGAQAAYINRHGKAFEVLLTL